ncbi:biotin-dependent carboxyltransferase [Thalassomonas viridans]|uniref:Biotin-dependent carboxyltransferase n=1 Tax=Thalassomonas viridans TaxID=137584 RepID=A0AAE9Z2V6_9GAMM|nr:biotin-dependent carboxyltransferase family protein [Thalassomonas viridans]WDE05771.1 biotin-dependent carboxyltransferase [Thalassomonas viridans]
MQTFIPVPGETGRQNTLTILKSGGLCSIQDLGRPGSQHLGFSGGGAADEHAYLTANQLLGNEANAAALEITLGQLVLRAECHCTLAVTGADCRIYLNEQPVSNWQVLQLAAGDTLAFSLPTSGLHNYLAVYGGIDAPLWLGSRAQTLNERNLAAAQKEISAGCDIPLTPFCFNPGAGQAPKQQQRKKAYANFYPDGVLTARFIPHKLWFSLDSKLQQRFLDAEYTIDRDSNRMGYRLTSKHAALPQENPGGSPDITLPTGLSRAVAFGSIQLPDFRRPIVLMKERQTIGGYPVIGAVMQTDLFRLSQKRPGESLRFIPVSLEQARQQLAEFYRQRLNSDSSQFRPAHAPG